jgi:hypothetical protein
MAKKVSSFDELTTFIRSFGVEDSESIHIAEQFMDKNSINFDADGNFDAMDVDYQADKKTLVKC